MVDNEARANKLSDQFIIFILLCLIEGEIIFEAGITIITQHFGVIVVTECKYTTLTLGSKDLVMYSVTEIVIGYVLGLDMRQSGQKFL